MLIEAVKVGGDVGVVGVYLPKDPAGTLDPYTTAGTSRPGFSVQPLLTILLCGSAVFYCSGSNEMYQAGMIPLAFGKVFAKGQGMKAGQCPVLSYNRSVPVAHCMHAQLSCSTASIDCFGLTCACYVVYLLFIQGVDDQHTT